MSTYFNYNDPLISTRRKGDISDPFIPISQSISVSDNRVLLAEIPDEFNKVTVSGQSVTWVEVIDKKKVLESDDFRVDYTLGLIEFHSSRNGLELQFDYFGTGAYYFPVSRIWTLTDGVNVTETLQDVEDSRVSAETSRVNADNTRQAGYDSMIATSNFILKNPVTNFADISTTYPTPANGWAVRTTSDGKLYRYDSVSTTWVWIDTISSTAYDDLLAEIQSPSYSEKLTQNSSVFKVGTGEDSGGSPIDVSSSVVIGKVNTTVKGRTATNIVTNGNFANGTTDWTSNASTSTVSNNVLSNTADGTSISPNIRADINSVLSIDKKYFIRAIMRVTNADSVKFRLRFNGTTSGTQITFVEQISPIQDQWYNLYGIATITDQVGNLYIRPEHRYVDSTTANGKVMEVQEVIAMDLTAEGLDTYTADEINAMIPNWFDGIKSTNNTKITSIGKNLFDEQGKKTTIESGKSVLVFDGYFQSDGTPKNTSEPLILANGNALLKGTTYTIQGKFKATTYFNKVAILYADGTKDSSSNFTSDYTLDSVTITTDPIKEIMNMHIDTGGDDAYGYCELDSLQLELLNTATIYEEYKESTREITQTLRSLPNVKDEISDSGEFIQRVSGDLIINGSLSWSHSDTYTNVYRMSVANWTSSVTPNAKETGEIQGESDDGHYPYVGDNEDYRHIRLSTDILFVFIEKSLVDAEAGVDVADKFKNYLNTHPITLIYELANPITTQLNLTPFQAFENGTMIIESSTGDTEFIIPEIAYNVSLNTKAQVEGNIESVDQLSKSHNEHKNDINDPHNVTPAQVGAVNLTGDTMTGDLVIANGDLVISKNDANIILNALNTNNSAWIDLLENSNLFGTSGSFGYRIKYNGSANELQLISSNDTTTTTRMALPRDSDTIKINGLEIDNSVTGGTCLAITSASLDSSIVFGSDDRTTGDNNFEFRYTGSETGNNNSLELWATNSGSPNKVWRIQQDGILNLITGLQVNGSDVETQTGSQAKVDTRVSLEGDKTSDSGSTDVNKWTKIATTTLDTQFENVSTFILVTGGYHGNNPTQRGLIHFRVKQQNALGSNPYIQLYLMNNNNLGKENIMAVITEASVTQTVVELYIKVTNTYEALRFNPLLINKSGVIQFHSSQPYLATLPVGTQLACLYEDGEFETLKIGGNSVWHSGTFDATTVVTPSNSENLTQQSSVFKVGTGKNDLQVDIDVSSSVVNGKVDTTVKGQTLFNELNGSLTDTSKWTLDTGAVISSGELTITADGVDFIDTKLPVNLKDDTTYTVQCEIIENTLTRNDNNIVRDAGLGSLGSVAFPLTTGIFKATFSTGTITDNTFWSYARSDEVNGSYIKIKNLIVLEGDYSNKVMPYFEGVKSTVNTKITSTGKNLFNPNKPYFSKSSATINEPIILNDTITITMNGDKSWATVEWQYDLKPNTVYTIKDITTTDGETAGLKIKDIITSQTLYDGSTTNNAEDTFTTLSKGKISIYLYVSGSTAGQYTVTHKVQLEENSTATVFESYTYSEREINQTLRSLPNGTVDEVTDSGEFIQRISNNVVLDGSLSWTFSVDYTGFKRVKVSIGTDVINGSERVIKDDGRILDHWDNSTYNWTQGDISNLVLADGYLYISIADIDSGWAEAYTPSVADIQTYFNAQPYTLNYELATPTITQLNLTPFQAFENGTMIIESSTGDTEFIIPEITYTATLNTKAQIEGNIENVEQLSKVHNNHINVYNSHINDTNDPHNVTPSQVGAVDLTGDTMTGNLVIQNANANIILRPVTSESSSWIDLLKDADTFGIDGRGFRIKIDATSSELQFISGNNATTTVRLAIPRDSNDIKIGGNSVWHSGTFDPTTKADTTTATTIANGLMSSTDKTKLDGVEASANNYVHPANHPATIITEDTTHRFATDTEKTTWNGAEPSFTKNTGFNKNLGTTTGTVAEGNHTHNGGATIASGSYTGDGTSTGRIINIGFTPKYVFIKKRGTGEVWISVSTNQCIYIASSGSNGLYMHIDVNGFNVADGSGGFVNNSGVDYDWSAIG